MLSPLDIDAIGELFNLGLGTGTAALSEMTGRRIAVSPPQVSVTYLNSGAAPEDMHDTVGVRLAISNAMEGEAIMYLPSESGLQLARVVHMVWLDQEDLENEGPEFVLSIGGEILQLCMTEIADQLQCEIQLNSPEYLDHQKVELRAQAKTEGESIWMRFNFKVEGYPIEGKIAFHMADGGFLDLVRNMLKRMSS